LLLTLFQVDHLTRARPVRKATLLRHRVTPGELKTKLAPYPRFTPSVGEDFASPNGEVQASSVLQSPFRLVPRSFGAGDTPKPSVELRSSSPDSTASKLVGGTELCTASPPQCRVPRGGMTTCTFDYASPGSIVGVCLHFLTLSVRMDQMVSPSEKSTWEYHDNPGCWVCPSRIP
jgi:hypothetical protein